MLLEVANSRPFKSRFPQGDDDDDFATTAQKVVSWELPHCSSVSGMKLILAPRGPVKI